MPVEVELVGTSAIVTGAGQGIGYAIADHLMAAGADVLVYEIDPARARAAAKRLSAEHPSQRALPFAGDVTDEAAMRAAFELASESFGPPRILVNNALYQYPDLIVRVPVAEWERVLGVIATGTFIGTREFGRHFMEHGLAGGAIVNISTLNYTAPASMLGCVLLREGRRFAVHERRGPRVRVDGDPRERDCSGPRQYRAFRRIPRPEPRGAGRVRRQHTLARVGEPDDQARVAVFLASTASAWMSRGHATGRWGDAPSRRSRQLGTVQGPARQDRANSADWLTDARHASGG